ncbi:MAG: fibronectin type III domain-containing protein [Patescibacteria group bacterium]
MKCLRNFFIVIALPVFIFLSFTGYARADISTGLIDQFNFEEGSGTTANDSSSSGNTGTISGGATYTTGRINSYALRFDGVDGQVTAPLNFTSWPVTECAWIKPTTIISGITGIIPAIANGLYIQSDGINQSLYTETLGGFGGSNAISLTVDTWQHVCSVIIDATTGEYYLNGSPVGAGVESYGGGVFVGGISIGSGRYTAFTGDIDDVRIYSRALSDADILQLYNNEGADVAPPVLSSIATSTTNTTATITWTTVEAASSTINYGATTAYGSASSTAGFNTVHSVTLTGLTPSTVYHFQISSSDSAGNLATSSDRTFTTATPDLTAPVISSIVTSTTNTAATITWTTDDLSDTQVEYGPTSSYTASTTLVTTATTSHRVTITGLSSGTTYHYNVRSRNGTDVLGTSTDATFITTTPGPTIPLYVSAKGIAPDHINLVWRQSTDNDGTVTGYKIYRNGVLIDTVDPVDYISPYEDTSVNYYQDRGVSPATTYSYYIIAHDSAGYDSPQSATVYATTTAGSLGTLLPEERRTDWTPGVSVGVVGGIDQYITGRTNIVDVTASPYLVDTSGVITTAAITNQSSDVVVGSAANFSVGQAVYVQHGLAYNTGLSTTITAINGNTITLAASITYATSSLVEFAHDASPGIQAAVNAAASGDVIYIPAGTYILNGGIYLQNKSNVTLRGAGRDETVFDVRLNGISLRGVGVELSYPISNVLSGAVKGSTELTVADASLFQVGDLAVINTRNDDTIPVIAPTGGNRIRYQITRVTAVSTLNNTVSIFPAVTADIDAASTTVYAVPGAQVVSNVGLEDFTLDGSNSLVQLGIALDGVYNTWVKNVKVTGITNYGIRVSQSLGCEIRHSEIQFSSAGSNKAGLLSGGMYNCLVEDNAFIDAFPVIEINASTGNVFAFNYMKGNSNTNHGAYSDYNLYEGNYADEFKSDGYYGGEGNATYFRNYVTGFFVGKRFSRYFNYIGNIASGYSFGQPNIGNGNSDGFALPSQGVYWKDWNPTVGPTIAGIFTKASSTEGSLVLNSHVDAVRLYSYMLILGCGSTSATVLSGCAHPIGLDWGLGKDDNKYRFSYIKTLNLNTDTIELAVTYSVGAALPDSGTAAAIWPRSEGFQELDMEVNLTALKKNNYVDGGISSFEELANGETMPSSLFRSSKPSYFNNLNWPPFDPSDPTVSVEDIPAGYRYVNGLDPGQTDTTAPSITSIASTTAATTARITWNTSESATSTVDYGLTTSYGTASSSNTSATSHVYNLSGLTPSTVYHFRINVADSSGNVANSTDKTFTTTAVAAPVAPVISSVDANPGQTSTSITWRTDEAADSQIYYGLTSSYGSVTSLDADRVLNHEVEITGLLKRTTYHFQVVSTDVDGMTSTSSDETFTTRSSGGGGGGGGSRITPRAPTVATTSTASVVAPVVVTSSAAPLTYSAPSGGGISAGYTFTRDLTINSKGVDVIYLQKFLVKSGYLASAYVTGLFETFTQQALIKYQLAHGITPATGYFGPITRGKINNNSGVTAAPIISVTPTGTVVSPVRTSVAIFTRDLQMGSVGEDVRALQVFLNNNGYTVSVTGFGSKGNESTTFGPATKAALIKFQQAKGITPAAGYFGPKTRGIVKGI